MVLSIQNGSTPICPAWTIKPTLRGVNAVSMRNSPELEAKAPDILGHQLVEEVDGSASAAEGEPAAQPLRVATAGLERREVDGSDIYRIQQIRVGF